MPLTIRQRARDVADRFGVRRPVRRMYRILRGIPVRRYFRRRRIMKLYRAFIAPGQLAFDIGANVGERTALMRTLGARVISVEPQRELAELLQTRFSGDRNVIVEQAAVGMHEGMMQLAKVPGISTVASLSPEWQERGPFSEGFKNAEYEDVHVVTLDHLIQQYGLPVFCKIDVEEFEDQVLAGLSQTIPAISFEYHRAFLDKVQLCISHLESLGKPQFNFTPEETMQWGLDHWVNGSQLLEHLKTIADDEHGWGDVYAIFT